MQQAISASALHGAGFARIVLLTLLVLEDHRSGEIPVKHAATTESPRHCPVAAAAVTPRLL